MVLNSHSLVVEKLLANMVMGLTLVTENVLPTKFRWEPN